MSGSSTFFDTVGVVADSPSGSSTTFDIVGAGIEPAGSSTFAGDVVGVGLHHSGPTGGAFAVVAPTNVFGGTSGAGAKIPPANVFGGPTGAQARIPPVRGFGGSTGASFPVQAPDHFSGTTDGETLVVPRHFSGVTNARVNSLLPARGFGGGTGGVVEGIPSPLNLTATVIDAGCIRLDWVDPSDEEDNYRIERSLADADDWGIIADNLPENTESFLDRFAVPLVVYDYRVIGFDPDRESLPSNIATAVTPLPPDIVTGAPPTAPQDPQRNRIKPKPIDLLSPGTYGFEKDEDGDVTGFKF